MTRHLPFASGGTASTPSASETQTSGRGGTRPSTCTRYPLRTVRQKLHTLDPIRIIEGKV